MTACRTKIFPLVNVYISACIQTFYAPLKWLSRAFAAHDPAYTPHRQVRMGRMKTRLDRLLVERGLAESREKAQALIMAGEVLVDGQKASKPGQSVGAGCAVSVLARPPYVS